MSIPESVIERVRFKNANTCESMEDAALRARRVILALAKEMPPEAVKAALNEYYWQSPTNSPIERMHAAIAAFLTHVAGDTP